MIRILAIALTLASMTLPAVAFWHGSGGGSSSNFMRITNTADVRVTNTGDIRVVSP